MPEKSAFRRRVTPALPFLLNVEDANGDKFTMAFRLVYDLNALAVFEEISGKNFLAQMGEILTEPSVKTLTALLWVGTQETYPGYDGLTTIRANVTLADLPVVKKACIDALLSQLPKESRDKLLALVEGRPVPADPTSPATASA